MNATKVERRLVGQFEWQDGKHMHVQGHYDRVAIRGTRLAMLSLVAPIAEVKAMRAAIGSGCTVAMEFSGAQTPKNSSRVYADNDGYTINVFRMPYGMCHAVFINRAPGLLLDNSDNALWAELKDPRFSTPLLRGWLSYLRDQLEVEGRLQDCDRVNCTCRSLSASEKYLDELVQVGLKNGLISIREE